MTPHNAEKPTPASLADPIEDWCPQWGYGVCSCKYMCPDDRDITRADQ